MKDREIASVRPKAREDWKRIRLDDEETEKYKLISEASRLQKIAHAAQEQVVASREEPFVGLWSGSKHRQCILPIVAVDRVSEATGSAWQGDRYDRVVRKGAKDRCSACPRAMNLIHGCSFKKNICRVHSLLQREVGALDRLTYRLSKWCDSVPADIMDECMA